MKAIKILQAVLLMILLAFAASSRTLKTNSDKRQAIEETVKKDLCKKQNSFLLIY